MKMLGCAGQILYICRGELRPIATSSIRRTLRVESRYDDASTE